MILTNFYKNALKSALLLQVYVSDFHKRTKELSFLLSLIG